MTSSDSQPAVIPAGKSIIKVREIYKSFGTVPVLSGVSFSLREGEILGVIGPSGGGKSTLLRCINLLEPIDRGNIEYFNRFNFSADQGLEELLSNGNVGPLEDTALPALRQEVGLIFQGFNLWEEKSVLSNLTLAPRVVLRRHRHTVELKAHELCRQFGLEDKLGLPAWKLSGGQRQRVAIMRALMMEPKVLLLDEVTSALDPVLTYEVMQAIRKLQERGLTMIVVTHHLEFASSLCDRIMFLAHGQAVQVDTPDNLRNMPATEEVGRFLEILEAAR